MIEERRSGVDWISCTLGVNELDYHVWRGDATHALEVVAKEGHQVVPRRMLGFEGLSAGNCFVGQNETHTYAQFSGSYADMAFEYVMHPKVHVSRIDLQSTVKLVIMDKNIAKGAYREATLANKSLPESRRRKLWIIVGSDGGDTFYLGSASSEQRGRLYNKEVQSEDILYSRCWRYEVVFKNDLGSAIAREIPEAPDNRAAFCNAAVKAWYQRRGVLCALLGGSTDLILPIIRTKPTDIERKMHWIAKQVYPTVAYLCEQGYRDTLLVLLGLAGSE